jgi:heme O synthase-like polyprenyltransferase
MMEAKRIVRVRSRLFMIGVLAVVAAGVLLVVFNTGSVSLTVLVSVIGIVVVVLAIDRISESLPQDQREPPELRRMFAVFFGALTLVALVLAAQVVVGVVEKVGVRGFFSGGGYVIFVLLVVIGGLGWISVRLWRGPPQ